jgi:hypothetical protein
VQFKLAPTARDIERLARAPKVPPWLLVAPHLSETLVNHCKVLGVNCLDLNGRLWLREQGLFVDRQPSPGSRIRSASRGPNVFSAKSARLARTLLSNPDRKWSQCDLMNETGLSAGLVSRLVRHLTAEGILGAEDRLLSLKRDNALLDAWVAKDDWRRRTAVQQYALLEPDPVTAARCLAKDCLKELPVAFTQWFAANLRHPYTTSPVVSAYVTEFPPDQALEKLGARRVADGGTLWLVVPKDEGVFLETQQVGGLTLVCDTQIYLDLLQVGLRGPDHAQVFRDWRGFRGGAQ